MEKSKSSDLILKDNNIILVSTAPSFSGSFFIPSSTVNSVTSDLICSSIVQSVSTDISILKLPAVTISIPTCTTSWTVTSTETSVFGITYYWPEWHWNCSLKQQELLPDVNLSLDLALDVAVRLSITINSSETVSSTFFTGTTNAKANFIVSATINQLQVSFGITIDNVGTTYTNNFFTKDWKTSISAGNTVSILNTDYVYANIEFEYIGPTINPVSQTLENDTGIVTINYNPALLMQLSNQTTKTGFFCVMSVTVSFTIPYTSVSDSFSASITIPLPIE